MGDVNVELHHSSSLPPPKEVAILCASWSLILKMIFSIPLFKVKSTYNALKDISDGTDESQIFLQPVIYRDQSSLERWSEYLAAYWIPINTVVFISGLVFVGIATWNFQYECSPKALGTYCESLSASHTKPNFSDWFQRLHMTDFL